jgi:hypothetical protein
MIPQDFEKLFNSSRQTTWDYDSLSECTYITWNIVINNLNKPWNLSKLSKNPIVTWDIIINTPFLKWDWENITANPNITFDIIYNNIMYPWNMNIIYNRFSSEQYNLISEKLEIITISNESDISEDSVENNNYLYIV